MANRAEIAAIELRHVAHAIEHQHVEGERVKAILESNRREAASALIRLQQEIYACLTTADDPDGLRKPLAAARLQHPACIREGTPAEIFREWAAAWDAWAITVDP